MEKDRSTSPDPLADVTGAREAVAAQVVAPQWYLMVVSLLVVQHVLVQGVADPNWTLPSGILLLFGSAVAWLVWRHRMGVTVVPIAGWRSALALGAWSLSALVCIWAAAASREAAAVVASAVVAWAAGAVLGRVWSGALRADITHPGRWTS